MAKHDVRFTLPERELGKADAEFEFGATERRSGA